MKKNKKTQPASLPENDNHPSTVNKKAILVTLVVCVVAVGAVALWKHYGETMQEVHQWIMHRLTSSIPSRTKVPQVEPVTVSPPVLPPTESLAPPQSETSSSASLTGLMAAVIDIQGRLNDISQRLQQQEQATADQLHTRDTVQVVVAYELLRNVLDGRVSLDDLKTYLQKNQAPWAHTLLTTLAPIPKSYTYAQLDALLHIDPSPESTSTNQKVLRFLGTFFSFKKLSDKDKAKLEKGVAPVQIEKVRERLKTSDIQGTLLLFEDLSEEDKTTFANFKVAALQQFTLESALKTLLKEMMKG